MKQRITTSMLASASCMAVAAALQFAIAAPASANQKLVELSKSNENWIMPGRDYSSQNYSPMTQINAQPYSEAEWHWRINVANGFGHGAAPETVAWVLDMLEVQGIDGELIVRDLNEGRAEVVQMWGRPESVRQEYRRRRSI